MTNININTIIKGLPHIADIFAIPLWLIMILYFYRIENKTPVEYVLFLFGSTGLLLDGLFSAYYVFGKKLI